MDKEGKLTVKVPDDVPDPELILTPRGSLSAPTSACPSPVSRSRCLGMYICVLSKLYHISPLNTRAFSGCIYTVVIRLVFIRGRHLFQHIQMHMFTWVQRIFVDLCGLPHSFLISALFCFLHSLQLHWYIIHSFALSQPSSSVRKYQMGRW